MRHVSLVTGFLAAAVTLWPLGPLGDMLFSAHMAQHLILIAIAAPLLVLGGIALPIRPALAWLIFIAVFLFWHLPFAFQGAALHHLTLLEMASILLAALLFWSAVLGETPTPDGARVLMVIAAAFITDLPGVIMLFAPRAICVMPGENAAHFGLTPLQDQQLAGLLMWVPANLVFFGIAIWLAARWLSPDWRPTPGAA